MADGFLGRWSRRKLDVKEGRPVEPEPPVARPSLPPAPASARGSEAATVTAPSPQPGEGGGEGASAPEQPPPPTLQDVQALTPSSDFTRFVQPDVGPEVKNAAMKKLFADPHFNVMDGLDVYIDDYTKADPIPESMLRQLAAGRFLGLFREEEEQEEARKDEAAAGAREDAGEPPSGSVAQSPPAAADAQPEPPQAVPPESHAHPDLRLQQDDAAGPGQAGRGAG